MRWMLADKWLVQNDNHRLSHVRVEFEDSTTPWKRCSVAATVAALLAIALLATVATTALLAAVAATTAAVAAATLLVAACM
jgi:hypothetical protein